jgi:hypothetical protein
MVSITTYNIRLDTDDDHPWQWAARKLYVLANLQRLDPDIFTVEEAEPHQLADLRTLTAYRGFGVPRENTVDQGEAAAIFIKKPSSTRWRRVMPGYPKRRTNRPFILGLGRIACSSGLSCGIKRMIRFFIW